MWVRRPRQITKEINGEKNVLEHRKCDASTGPESGEVVEKKLRRTVASVVWWMLMVGLWLLQSLIRQLRGWLKYARRRISKFEFGLNEIKVWRLTGFYVHPEHTLQPYSWVLLQRFAGMSALPWVIIGDFNEVVCDSERKGGLQKDWRDMMNFRETSEDCNLADMGHLGPFFTWCNGWDGYDQIQERLDRPILLEFSKEDAVRGGFGDRRERHFHFEESWVKKQECQDLITVFRRVAIAPDQFWQFIKRSRNVQSI
ncbi:hypothetical protein Ddye_016047 [Dipteronia dyeriana]|uniref:Endonuclease/exonuclease/phosphatase domain-containing protein n=1 Tax=Dipteronia dyeriana TaxID=168575 RepID=A0AAD9WZQ9_9ROSI|nr:hypothetical protein Ddye_016047 [Dipteronia dyeriana]